MRIYVNYGGQVDCGVCAGSTTLRYVTLLRELCYVARCCWRFVGRYSWLSSSN